MLVREVTSLGLRVVLHSLPREQRREAIEFNVERGCGRRWPGAREVVLYPAYTGGQATTLSKLGYPCFHPPPPGSIILAGRTILREEELNEGLPSEGVKT